MHASVYNRWTNDGRCVCMLVYTTGGLMMVCVHASVCNRWTNDGRCVCMLVYTTGGLMMDGVCAC